MQIFHNRQEGLYIYGSLLFLTKHHFRPFSRRKTDQRLKNELQNKKSKNTTFSTLFSKKQRHLTKKTLFLKKKFIKRQFSTLFSKKDANLAKKTRQKNIEK